MNDSNQDNYRALLNHVHTLALQYGRDPTEIQVVAVTKGVEWQSILPLYEAGCRHFGESRIQEALPKMDHLEGDAEWHLIGTLQKNKVRLAVDHFDLIHSVDRPELATKISTYSQESNKYTRILLQVNTSGELSKHGLSIDQWTASLSAIIDLPNLSIEGLMTIAPLTNDQVVIRNCFSQLRGFRDNLQKKYGDLHPFKHLSMGMSHDYAIAIEEGATLLRIGSAIFTNPNRNTRI